MIRRLARCAARAAGAPRAAGALCAIGVLGVSASVAQASAPPQLSVRSAIVIEQSTGRELDGINANARVPIASTTKLMTALVTLEHVHHLGVMFTQNHYFAAPVDSQIGLVPGERMSVHDLLLALMLPSADDAAEDLAFNVGHGSISHFIGMMNARARQLGLTHTHYTTPIGLDTAGNYSSASDLVKLASYALQHSRYFARIVGLPRAVLHTGNRVRVVVNRNDLVARFGWINGVKTGHTSGAGYVLVASATRARMTLLSAVLGTASEASRDANTLALLNYGFGNFAFRTALRTGTVLARPTVKNQPGKHAVVVATATVTGLFPRSTVFRIRVDVPKQLSGPLKAHAVVGRAVVFAGRRVVARVPLELAGALPAVSPLTLAARFLTRATTLVPIVALILVAFTLIGVWRARQRGRDATRVPA